MPRKYPNHSRYSYARGQLYSSDALLSIVIFLFVLTVISTVSQQLQNQSLDELQNYRTTQRASRVAQTLFTSTGNPVYWDTNSDRNNVLSVGVSNNGIEISPQKWLALLDWNADDYPDLARRMGIGDLNFYITITDENKEVISQLGTAPIDKNQVSVVMFPVLYASQGAVATLQVYGG